MKRYTLLVFLVLFMVSCMSKPEKVDATSASLNRDLAEIKKEKNLRILVQSSPESYFLFKGQEMGYDYEIMNMFAEHIGVKTEYILVPHPDSLIPMLNANKGDIIAADLTITGDRRKLINFSNPYLKTKQLLVQQADAVNKVTEDLQNLESTVIHTWKGSSYNNRLQNLENEMGKKLFIEYDNEENSTEHLIRMVHEKKIEATIADEHIAKVCTRFYPDIDLSVSISFPQEIGYGVRKNSPELLKSLNTWLKKVDGSAKYNYIYKKYFEMKSYTNKALKDYSSYTDTSISVYDNTIKAACAKHGIEWHLLASLMYQESRFDPKQRSWVGAFGLMQFMPATGRSYGIHPGSPPEAQIYAGAKKLSRDIAYWEEILGDRTEATKFALATYNAGKGHVLDAQRLAEKYQKDPHKWDENVETCMILLKQSKYYRDPVIRHGYVRGTEPVNYVEQIMKRVKVYQTLYPN